MNLALAALLMSSALSQLANHPQMPGGDSLPSTFERNSEGAPREVWVVYHEFRPLVLPAYGSDEVALVSLQFLQKVAVIAIHETGQPKHTFFLVGELNEAKTRVSRHYGWVPGDYVLEASVCMVDPKTTIQRKAMLVNPQSPEEMEEFLAQMQGNSTDAKRSGAGEEETILRSSVRLRPTDAAPVGESFPWFSFFFVYAETNNYLLLGSSPSFHERNVRGVIKGWVPRTMVCEWNTREAYHWDRDSTLRDRQDTRRTAEAHVYRHYDQAYDVLRRARNRALLENAPHWSLPPADAPDDPDKIRVHGDAIAREQFDEDAESREVLPCEPRYPNLGWDGDPPLYPAVDLQDNIRLLRVGVIGGIGEFSSAEVARLRRDLWEMMQDISHLQILFVIDDTGSMVRWFDIVARIVRTITEDAVGVVGGGIQIDDALAGVPGHAPKAGGLSIAVSYYNDLKYCPRRRGWFHEPELNELRPVLSAADGVAIARQVAEHSPTENLKPRVREMVFDGIRRAISKANFRPDARRVVIVLGDMGDISDDYQRIADDMARSLQASSGNPIEFYPICVASQGVRHEAYDIFTKQMQTVLSRLNRDAYAYAKTIAERMTPDEEVAYVKRGEFFRPQTKDDRTAAQAVATHILDRYRDQRASIVNLQRRLARAMHGDWKTIFPPEILQAMESRGFPIKQLQATRGAQMFEEGFVWEHCGLLDENGDPIPQMRLWALLTRRDVQLLQSMLLVLTTEGRDGPLALEKAVIKLIQDLTGDRDEQNLRSQSLLIAMQEKIPGLHARTPLLRLAVNNIDFNISREHLEELAVKACRLQDIVEGRRSEWIRRSVPGRRMPIFVRESWEPYDRTYVIPDSTEDWFWIDVERELP